MSPTLVLAACAVASGFALRIVDPIVLPVAAHFQVSAPLAASLATAYALPYAFAQPLLGPLGDRFGKANLIRWCVSVLALMLLAGALAPTFALLFATRIGAGAAAGGLIPLVLASIGDRYALAERQVAIARMLFAIIGGQMGGSIAAGAIHAVWGWHAVFVTATVLAAAVAAAAWRWLPREGPVPGTASGLRALYGLVFANPKAVWLYGAVFVEGIAIYAAFPFMGEVLVATTGAEPARVALEAGLVLGAFGLGGLAYAASVRPLLRRLGARGLCLVGAVVAAAGYAAMAWIGLWWLHAAAMFAIGFAFYMIHSSLQTEATEIAPAARGSAFALFACGFFAGQGVGPLLFGPLLHGFGAAAALLTMSALLLALGRVVGQRIVVRNPSAA